MSQEYIQDTQKDLEKLPEGNAFLTLMGKAKKILRGKAFRAFSAATAAGTLFLAAQFDTAKAFSPDSLPSRTSIATKIEVDEDLPSEVETVAGAFLQVHPLVPNAELDIPILPQTFKVTGEKFDNYIVKLNGESYFLPKKYVLDEAVPTVPEQIVEEQYVVIKVVEGNARSTPDTTSNNNIISKVALGDELKTTGQVEKNAAGIITWYEVTLPNGKNAWVSTLIIEDKLVTKTETIVSSNEITSTNQITETNNISTDEEIASSVVLTGTIDTEAKGGDISESEINSLAQQVFGPDVTVDMTGIYPLAKLDKFVVGEFKEGVWQNIREIKILTQTELSYYPNTQEKMDENGNKIIVQNIYDQEVIVAVRDDENKNWIEPTKTSYELTVLTVNKNIMSKKVSGTEAEAQSNRNPTPYEYKISARPDVVENEPQKRRSLVIEGIANEGFKIIEFPVIREVNGTLEDTGWRIRLTILPTSSIDKKGNWYTDNIIVGATQQLVNNNQIYWSTFLGEQPLNDIVTYSKLGNPFNENDVYDSSFPITLLKDADIEDGDAVALYVYDMTAEDSSQYQEDVAYVKEMIGDFQFRVDDVPNQDQIDFTGTFLLKGLFEGIKVEGITTDFTDSTINELINNGGTANDINYYGNTTAVHKIID